MEREANYTAVGAFVLLIVTMAALFVYWYAGNADDRDYTRYEIYFEGSVSGLNRGSTVRYLGVEVGRVVAIRIDKRAADRVQVIAEIDSQAPISKETLASLSLQGVTGLLYIDLLANADLKRKMAPVPSEQYPVIDSVQVQLRPVPRQSSGPGGARRRRRRSRLAGAVRREPRRLQQHHAQHRAECGDVADDDARRRGGGGAIQGHQRRSARRRGRRPDAHRHLGTGPRRRFRADSQDLGESRGHHGQSRSADDGSSR